MAPLCSSEFPLVLWDVGHATRRSDAAFLLIARQHWLNFWQGQKVWSTLENSPLVWFDYHAKSIAACHTVWLYVVSAIRADAAGSAACYGRVADPLEIRPSTRYHAHFGRSRLWYDRNYGERPVQEKSDSSASSLSAFQGHSRRRRRRRRRGNSGSDKLSLCPFLTYNL